MEQKHPSFDTFQIYDKQVAFGLHVHHFIVVFRESELLLRLACVVFEKFLLDYLLRYDLVYLANVLETYHVFTLNKSSSGKQLESKLTFFVVFVRLQDF